MVGFPWTGCSSLDRIAPAAGYPAVESHPRPGTDQDTHRILNRPPA